MDAVSSLTSLCDWYVASRMILLDLLIVRFLLLGGFFFLLAVTERAFREAVDLILFIKVIGRQVSIIKYESTANRLIKI